MAGAGPALQPVLRLGPIAIDAAPGGSGVLVIACSSVGHDPARLPEPEFRRIATAQDRPALFLRDASRSWATAPEFAPALLQAVADLRARQPITRIVTLGLSMGGFAALAAADLLGAQAALAIGPQACTRDPRWAGWTSPLPPRPCPLPQGCWISLCHGLRDDAATAARFAPRRGIDHFLFAGLGHSDLGPHLKTKGLQGMVDAICAGDRRRLIRLASAAGGQRQLPR